VVVARSALLATGFRSAEIDAGRRGIADSGAKRGTGQETLERERPRQDAHDQDAGDIPSPWCKRCHDAR
jgi:hypothetical protein